MRVWLRTVLAGLVVFVLHTPPVVPVGAQAPAVAPAVTAKTWVGKYAEYEEYLRTAEIEQD